MPPEVAIVAADAKRLSVLDLIETLQAQQNLNNTMVRQLGGHMLDEPTDLDTLLLNAKQTLRDALWVGRQEALEADLPRLSSRLGSELNQVRANVTPSRPAYADESPVLLSRLRALNAHDLELWEWANQALF